MEFIQRHAMIQPGWYSTIMVTVMLTSVCLGQSNSIPVLKYESQVPSYTLPDPLTFADGTPVKTAQQWTETRRQQIFDLFATEVYGKAPPTTEKVKYRIISEKADALGGKATRREIAITLAEEPKPLVMTVLLYLPNHVEKAPVFFGLNFFGNHTITYENDVQLNPNFMRAHGVGVVAGKATEASRGTAQAAWPVDLIIERGFGLATAYNGDIDPDFDDGFKNGIHAAFSQAGQTSRASDDWGSICAWAWGLSRGLDVLQQISGVDGSKVAVIGHSRLGKTALWAGACDQRFAMAISNNSGCGGAAISRRQFGETIAKINHAVGYWFCENFKKYNDNEEKLPVDQHELIALMAPRPVYVGSATKDLWADPKGEFLACVHAGPVYELLGKSGLNGTFSPVELPRPDQPLNTGNIGYHLRTGSHALTEYDWIQYMDFASRHFDMNSVLSNN